MFNDLKLAFNAGKDLKLNCKQASATIAAATTPAATCLCCAPCCLMILHASCHVPFLQSAGTPRQRVSGLSPTSTSCAVPCVDF